MKDSVRNTVAKVAKVTSHVVSEVGTLVWVKAAEQEISAGFLSSTHTIKGNFYRVRGRSRKRSYYSFIYWILVGFFLVFCLICHIVFISYLELIVASLATSKA